MIHRALGVSICAREPIWRGQAVVDDEIAAKADSFGFGSTALIGFDSADITWTERVSVLEGWIESGLGRHIEFVDEAGVVVWEGFVNEVAVGSASRAVRRGPLLGVNNRIRVEAQTISYNTNPPVGGTPYVTDWGENSESQNLYGIQEEIVNGGERKFVHAVQLRDMYLLENAYPEVSNDFDISGSVQASITLSCLGYGHWLGKYFYRNVGHGLTTISAKIQTILAADPNNFFTDFSMIAPNSFSIFANQAKYARASSLIQDMVTDGDASNNRYNFGIYVNRKPVYEIVPSDIEYLQYMSGGRTYVEDKSGAIVNPWNMRPGRWLEFSDLTIRAPQSLPNNANYRRMFVESVRFDAPYSFVMSGGRVNSIDQALARIS